MKLLFFSFCIGFFSVSLSAQSNDSSWKKLNDLSGKWVATGSGEPGQGSGSFSFGYDLDKKVMVRKSHSEYPATANKAATIHDDLMIIYDGGARAVYFDNEGHTIHYQISYPHGAIQFLSDAQPNTPVFRLTYSFVEKNKLNINFEMAMPQSAGNFRSYVRGVADRVK